MRSGSPEVEPPARSPQGSWGTCPARSADQPRLRRRSPSCAATHPCRHSGSSSAPDALNTRHTGPARSILGQTADTAITPCLHHQRRVDHGTRQSEFLKSTVSQVQIQIDLGLIGIPTKRGAFFSINLCSSTEPERSGCGIESMTSRTSRLLKIIAVSKARSEPSSS